MFPNDEKERDRLDLQHNIFLMLLEGKLFLAPLSSSPQRILDVGTGTGIWAIDVADKYPSAVVVGVDLSPIQPEWVPPNCEFQVDDMNEVWTFKEGFDFIHCRQVHMVLDEKRLFRQSINALKPGGWLEIKQILPCMCQDHTLKNTFLARWTEEMVNALRLNGTPFDKPEDYGKWMREAGFVNVQVFLHLLPVNPWPKNPELKKLGLWQSLNLEEGLEGFSVALFREILGWTTEQLDVLLAGVRSELKNTKIHAYSHVITVIGQKPTLSESSREAAD
jgi:SAM-dependent methyltransferase